MIRNDLFRKLFKLQQNVYTVRSCSSKLNIQNLENEQLSEVIDDDELRQKEEELDGKRNKSRLRPADYRMLHENDPYPEPTSWHHGSLKYIRRTYGRYGQASGVDPSLCCPVKQELKEILEYESVKYPYTIPEMIQTAMAKKAAEQKTKMERQHDIVKKMQKLEQWKYELHEKIAKKENEAQEARSRRERLIEEVRRHFGYTVDPKDERFKELLEKKEKEQKKTIKEARKKAREEKMVQKISKKASGAEEIENVNDDDKKGEKVD